jgi:formate hydrogenlyase subunit 3/multisubunit Na+/H+ antiporter MnhD subunit
MDIQIFKLVLLGSAGLFFLQKKHLHWFSLLLQALIIIVTSLNAVKAFIIADNVVLPFFEIAGQPVPFVIDRLSAFFVLLINFVMLMGMLYAKGYLKPYLEKKSRAEMAFHYFNFIWLHISMLMVCMFRDALAFLVAWELMSISSFFLVIFENEKEETVRTGLKYLIQMHIGFIFIIAAFLISLHQSGGEFSFDGLQLYFYSHSPVFLFLMFFVGFGIKAGFIPLHTWLPHAHPAAPSHVSGVMSGIMIKMGIYGILRVFTHVQTDLMAIGIIVLLISLVSGILGIVNAIGQKDIKKMLAYSSIENIGIIGLGIGLGIIGMASGVATLAVLGFAAALLHILNHALFKPLLFFSAGSVYSQTHTRIIDQPGGLIKKMPKTALLSLIGSVAICGLPPLNGFISEFLMYAGMFKSLNNGNLLNNLILLTSIIGLVLIGGLAIFGFTRVFSSIFLGNPRSNVIDHVNEVGNSMLFPKIIIAVIIVAVGLSPFLIIKPVVSIVGIFTPDTTAIDPFINSLTNISLVALILIALIGIIWVLKKQTQKKAVIAAGPTWGCGYSGADPSKHQYTATSLADNVGELASPVLHLRKKYDNLKEEEVFPQERDFETSSLDLFEKGMVTKPARAILNFMRRQAIFQTGSLQHYLLYALIFMIAIFVLSIMHII